MTPTLSAKIIGRIRDYPAISGQITVGIGEGVSPSAATDLIARLILAPPLIQTYGWESVFVLLIWISWSNLAPEY
ncbi:hypothetical protein MKW98_014206 [Papaver atlanticum]|uniref:Uncharacterized protein n=1 Tax=Papaver atlanticum TaxID=357466 RepID=A0AAD4XER0_9MAGN|nr:hypothetical protein MKW98_014206 [Papaver atlanticum]